MKKILLIASTHGDEKVGLEIMANLKDLKNSFDVLVANPKAAKANQRFIDADLNRSYPGNRFSSKYEERQACKNFAIARKYKYIIDLHEASAGTEDFIILPRDLTGVSFPLELIDLDKVLFWPFPQGPLSQFLENAIELEFGMKNRSRDMVIKKATRIIRSFILMMDSRLDSDNKKDFYYVYGFEDAKKIKRMDKYKDFKKAKLGKERFYPLLVGQYQSCGIAFYKMKKMVQ